MNFGTLTERKQLSESRLAELNDRIQGISEISQHKDFCIYATGSYARKEASIYSDLDLFFINASADGIAIPKLSKILIDAELIKMTRDMGFSDFSGDGEYLQIHSVDDLINQLGSQTDDYKNFFTARLLLILESYPLFNAGIYESILKQIVERYYTDFNDHNQDFLPIFLTNDIIRFWKTLTINYEHKRNRQSEEIKNKSHIKNLKLKFSRKLTCFSFILRIISREGIISVDDILAIAKQTPLERLVNLGKENQEQKDNVNALLKLYSWFLEKTNKPSKELYDWISDKEIRDEAFTKSKEFADIMYEVMKSVDRNGLLKYLII